MPRDSRSRSGHRYRRDHSRRRGGRSDRYQRSWSPRAHRRSEPRTAAPVSSKPFDLLSQWQSTSSHYDTSSYLLNMIVFCWPYSSLYSPLLLSVNKD